MAYLSIGDRKQEVERLVSALADIKRRHHKDKTGMLSQEYIPPKVVMTPQESFYASKESLPLEETKIEYAANLSCVIRQEFRFSPLERKSRIRLLITLFMRKKKDAP